MKNKFETISTISLLIFITSFFLSLIFFTISFEYENLLSFSETLFYISIISLISFFISNELSKIIKRIEKIESTLNISNKDEE